MKVHVSQQVYSSVPGRVGNWSYAADMDLPVVPCVGDWVTIPLANEPDGDGFRGEHTEVITSRFISPGHVYVRLRTIKTDSGSILDELAERLDAGWEQLGGPWPHQRTERP